MSAVFAHYGKCLRAVGAQLSDGAVVSKHGDQTDVLFAGKYLIKFIVTADADGNLYVATADPQSARHLKRGGPDCL